MSVATVRRSASRSAGARALALGGANVGVGWHRGEGDVDMAGRVEAGIAGGMSRRRHATKFCGAALKSAVGGACLSRS